MRTFALLLVATTLTSCAHNFGSAPSCTVKAGHTKWQMEIARSDEEREKGLMFRKSMPDDRGMIFVFPEPRMVAMWMKDTLIPLDMVFVDDRMQITSIQENAVPQSEDIIRARGDIKYALEINAGQVEKAAINVGDMIDMSQCPVE